MKGVIAVQVLLAQSAVEEAITAAIVYVKQTHEVFGTKARIVDSQIKEAQKALSALRESIAEHAQRAQGSNPEVESTHQSSKRLDRAQNATESFFRLKKEGDSQLWRKIGSEEDGRVIVRSASSITHKSASVNERELIVASDLIPGDPVEYVLDTWIALGTVKSREIGSSKVVVAVDHLEGDAPAGVKIGQELEMPEHMLTYYDRYSYAHD